MTPEEIWFWYKLGGGCEGKRREVTEGACNQEKSGCWVGEAKGHDSEQDSQAAQTWWTPSTPTRGARYLGCSFVYVAEPLYIVLQRSPICGLFTRILIVCDVGECLLKMQPVLLLGACPHWMSKAEVSIFRVTAVGEPGLFSELHVFNLNMF